jgi:E3 ubiquitin-protein ligase RAD18
MNYRLMKEGDMRKKLHALGIPNGGTKAAMIQRHLEWLNIWNANVDSTNPKSKAQLLKELEMWERTQGAGVVAPKPKVMEKDFNGQQWISDNRDHFNDLVANARKKRGVAKDNGNDQTKDEPQQNGVQPTNPPQGQELEAQREAIQATQNEPTTIKRQFSLSVNDDMSHPYEDNTIALEAVKHKVEHAAQDNGTALLPLRVDSSSKPPEEGISNPFLSPSRKVPMFQVSEDPVVDVEHTTKV